MEYTNKLRTGWSAQGPAFVKFQRQSVLSLSVLAKQFI